MEAAAVAVQSRVFPSLSKHKHLMESSMVKYLHVKCVQACLSDQSQNVILLKKKLTTGIEGNAMSCQFVNQFLGLFDDEIHCFVPCRLL